MLFQVFCFLFVCNRFVPAFHWLRNRYVECLLLACGLAPVLSRASDPDPVLFSNRRGSPGAAAAPVSG